MWRMISSRRSSSSRRGQRHCCNVHRTTPCNSAGTCDTHHATCSAVHATRCSTRDMQHAAWRHTMMPHGSSWHRETPRPLAGSAEPRVLWHAVRVSVAVLLRQEHKSLDGWKAQPIDAAADADEEGFATPPCNLPIIAGGASGNSVPPCVQRSEAATCNGTARCATQSVACTTRQATCNAARCARFLLACHTSSGMLRCRYPPHCPLSSTNATLWSATRRVVCLVRRSACGDGSRDASARCGNLSVRVWSACNMQHAPWQLSAGRPWTPRVTPAVRHVARCRGAARGTPRHVSHSGVECRGCDGRRRLPHG